MERSYISRFRLRGPRKNAEYFCGVEKPPQKKVGFPILPPLPCGEECASKKRRLRVPTILRVVGGIERLKGAFAEALLPLEGGDLPALF